METRTLEEKRSATVRLILNAATEVFAEVGFAGARVDDIARRAGVNKAMIYYRIGDKEALYSSVLHDVFSDTATRIAGQIKKGRSPEENLKAYIDNMAKTMDNHPHVPPIMMREIASGAGDFPEIVINDLIRLLDILTGILREGIKTGTFIAVNPLVIHLMIVGAIMTFKQVKAIKATQEKFPEKLRRMVDGVSKEVSEDIMALILRAVKQ